MTFLDQGFLLLVACLWGATTPFLNKGSVGLENVKGSGKLAELWFLITKFDYVIPFLMNQMGSVLFFWRLQSSELSLVVPVTNALAFVITSVVSYILGEKVSSKQSILGIMLVLLGTTVSMMDKEIGYNKEV